MTRGRLIAYFSMEVALKSEMPTYSGGLSVLAGDTIRSAADLRIPMVGMTLLHRKGYFHQKLDAQGWQTEEPVQWAVEDFLKEMPQRVTITLEGRTVHLRAWRYDVAGTTGFTVPVYFLDTDFSDNSPWDRTLTHFLYGGDAYYRLCQEVILGIGGVKMIRALGYDRLDRFHMNEGHASLLTLALLDERPKEADGAWCTSEDVEAVRRKCVFTTHTPVPAGHDVFPMDLVDRALGRPEIPATPELFCQDGKLNMTTLALRLSGYVNGVSKKHAEVSRAMFAPHPVDAVTNGVHAVTWTAKPFQELFDRALPGWREDNTALRFAVGLPKEEVWRAHLEAKKRLIEHVNQKTGVGMDMETFTIGFARRAATYKRGDLLLRDPARLKSICAKAGAIQLVYAGKAHSHDQGGKELIHRIFQAMELLKPEIKIAYLENYDMNLGAMMTAGADIWLNTPQPPLEASGTSGMKAALNGVPSLSILDGWWIEGYMEGVTGWAFGLLPEEKVSDEERAVRDAASLYEKLEQVVIPLFYRETDRFTRVMRHAIALNGSYFNTHRMIQQYMVKAYFH